MQYIDLEKVSDSDPGSALVMAGRAELCIEQELDSAFFDDEPSDLDGLAQLVPRISANASKLKFIDPSLTDEQKKDCPHTVVGIILARREGGFFHAFDHKNGAEKVDKAKRHGFTELLNTKGWICRNPNANDPTEARLNPALTKAQVEEAKRLGIGGATGRGCEGCAANWRKDKDDPEEKNFRLCTDTESLIWLDSKRSEAVVLQMSASTSIGFFRRWLTKTFKKGGKTLNLFTFLVKLTWGAHPTDKKCEREIVIPTELGPVRPDYIQHLKDLRKNSLWMFDQNSKAQAVLPDPTADGELPPFCTPEESALAEAAVGGVF